MTDESKDAGSWDRADEVLARVLDVPPDERPALMDRLCEGDGALLEEVRSLLEYVEPSQSFFDELADVLATGASGARPAKPPQSVPDRIGPYRFRRMLAGGMSLVFEAWDEGQEQPVVIKMARDPGDEASSERLVRAGRAEKSLDHPSICRVIDVGMTGKRGPYVVLEFCEGRTVAERLKDGPLPSLTGLAVGAQLADALALAHEQNVTHRDLKPANIMVDDSGNAKLLDFGIATGPGPPLTSQGVTLGTLDYMSPEQLAARLVGPATDVWSLSVVLCEAMQGEHPFRGANH